MLKTALSAAAGSAAVLLAFGGATSRSGGAILVFTPDLVLFLPNLLM